MLGCLDVASHDSAVLPWLQEPLSPTPSALLEARMDAGLAITNLIAADRQPTPEAAVEEGGGGGSGRTGERALEEEGLRRLASGDDASAEFIAQQQAMLDRLERRANRHLYAGEEHR